MQLRYKVSAVVGAAVLVTAAGSAVAFALAGHVPSSTETGNSLPIDDNHRGSQDRDLRVEPGDDRAGTTSVPARATQPRPTPSSTDAPDDSDGRVRTPGATSTDGPDDSDGRVRTATSAPTASSTDAPDDSDGRDDRSGSGSSGSGSDDDGDDDRSGSNSGSDDSGSDDTGSGGHGSDD